MWHFGAEVLHLPAQVPAVIRGVETTPPGSLPSLNMTAILFIPVYSVPCWLCVRLGFGAEFCRFLAGPGRVDWAGGGSWQSAVLTGA